MKGLTLNIEIKKVLEKKTILASISFKKYIKIDAGKKEKKRMLNNRRKKGKGMLKEKVTWRIQIFLFN